MIKEELLRFTLYAIIIPLICGILNSAVTASQSLCGNKTHYCGVIDGQSSTPYPDQFPNRRYARTAAANLNVGEPRTVRMIYFTPNDRSYNADVVQEMKDEIRKNQNFFAEQMSGYGYGKKTFQFETDSQGEPMVHHVVGEQPDNHYLDNAQGMIDEIKQSFDLNENVYLIVIDNSVEQVVPDAIGIGSRYSKNGGIALVNEQFGRPTAGGLATHELGHAFGLLHDFRESAYIMSYGPQQNRLSACHAEVLAVHPYFNPDIPATEGRGPTIKLISPRKYPAGTERISVEVEVSDSGGLHQVLLHGPDGLINCRGLAGKTDARVKFDYDGFFGGFGDYASVANLATHTVGVEAVDMEGNASRERFTITIEPSEVSGAEVEVKIPDVNLRAAIATALGKSPSAPINRGDMADLTTLVASDANITDLNGLENATNLYHVLNLEGNNISDIAPLAGLTKLTHLLLGDNNISDISPVARLTKLQVLNLQQNQIVDISAVADLTFLDVLRLQDNKILDISAVAGLTRLDALNLWNNNISDILPVAGLTNLAYLQLTGNNISDISPVAGLTNLIELSLGHNNISDISVLMGLTDLRGLSLGHNNISDISAVVGLINLRGLSLGHNNISNISAVVGLTDLGTLDIPSNNISDISAVVGLINLAHLNLAGNSILDIAPLVANSGLGSGDQVFLWRNPLSYQSIHTHIPTLQRREVTAQFDNRTPAPALKILGDNQQGVPGTTLKQPFVVDVRDRNGQLFAGVPVTFAITEGGGTLSVTNTMTDESGRAHSTLTLGSNPGTNTVEVSVANVSQTAVFRAEAIPPLPIPTTLEYVSGDNQSGLTGGALSHPFVVEVRDENGDPLEGVSVTFVVATGGGSLSDTSIDTGADGLARSTLTLGGDPGANTVEARVEDIAEMVTFTALAQIEFNLSVPAGISLIHVPLRVAAVDGDAKTIEFISDLYDVLGGEGNVIYLVTRDSQTQGWINYLSPSHRGTPVDRKLTDDMGIIANLINAVPLHLRGSPLGENGSSTITLKPGINLVGLPLRDSGLTHVSDLFALEGIKDNVSAVMLIDNGKPKVIQRASDASAIPIIGGQSFIMTAQRRAIVTISGDGWSNSSAMAAAPPIARTHIEVKDTTPVLALKGSIVDEGTGLKTEVFRVTVKNLSTGRAFATVTTPDEAGYQSTVVDIETGRAATVGDALEISARSPNPFVGVEPLRYIVTVEDVKQSLVQLPNLFAYEIPSETQLLSNYPNPFNPETWIPYRLAEDAFVSLTIYDLNGQAVRTIDVGHQTAAVYESRSKAVYWDGQNGLGEQVASGVYFYHLSAGDYSSTRKMVILK